MTFGQFIRHQRLDRGLSQQALAAACGFSQRANVSKLEAGKLEWKLEQVIVVARLFEMSASQLLAEFEAYEKQSH